MNLMRGEILGEEGRAVFRTNGLAFDLPPALAAAAKSRGATLGVRPEHVDVSPGGDRRLRVGLVEPLGKDNLLYFNTGMERPFVAVCEGLAMASVRNGEEVAISVDPARLYLFDESGRRLQPEPPRS